MRELFIVLVFLLISGCSTIKVKADKMHLVKLATDNGERARACQGPIQANPKYSKLYEKLAIVFGQEPSERQLADEEVIADSSLQLGLDWYTEYQYCLAKQIEDAGKLDPVYGAILANVQLKQVLIINEIVSKRPTYGHINRSISSLRSELRSEARKWYDDLDVRIQAIERRKSDHNNGGYISAIGEFGVEFVASFIDAVYLIGKAQAELNQSANAYMASHPNYTKIDMIRTTECKVVFNHISCQTY